MIQTIAHLSALSAGHQLWIAPPLESSSWSQKMDWYLNFQISKISELKSSDRSQGLKDLLSEIEWNLPQIRSEQEGAAMIFSESFLPARWVVLIKKFKDEHDFILQTQKIWLGLNKPSLRIFAPPGLTSSSQIDLSTLFGTSTEISIVF